MLCYVKLYCIILNILSFEDEDNYEDDYDDVRRMRMTII